MQNSKQFDEAEGVFKRHGRRRTRKSHWRQRWITLSKGARLDRRAILQTMRGPETSTDCDVASAFERRILAATSVC